MARPAAPLLLQGLTLAKTLAIGLVGWSTIAVLFSAQAYWFGHAAGRPQPWWPSLAYTLAVFSIWAVLTPLLALAARRTGRLRLQAQAALAVLGLPAALALHAALFTALFWRVYSDDGRLGPLAVTEGMLVANIHTNILFYAVVLAGATIRSRRPAAAPAGPALHALKVRGRGRVSFLPLIEIDWLEAAGNYAQAHSGGRAILIDESLSGLAARLPASGFARIHRRAIVRLDRIAEVRSLGRGDARVRLRDGTELRLSRRYRPALRGWLSGGPAHPGGGPARG